MDINHKNYEEFVLDYLENTLPSSQQQKMERFLIENPEVSKEIEDLLDFRVEPKSVRFQQKEQLLKSKSPKYFNIWSIAAAIALLFGSTLFIFNRLESNATPTENNKSSQQQTIDSLQQQLPVENGLEEQELQADNEQLNKKKQNNDSNNKQQSPIEQQPGIKPQLQEKEYNNYVESSPDNRNITVPVQKKQEQRTSPNLQKQEPNLAVQEESPNQQSVSPKQKVINDILKQNKDSIKKNGSEVAQEVEPNDGFSIEKHPDDKELYAEDQENIEGKQKKKKLKEKVLKGILGEDSDEIKKAVLPRSFGLNEEENTTPVELPKTQPNMQKPLPEANDKIEKP